ncbi:MAG: hypothetical protein AB7Q16_16255 [Vicinamibacterales bacterium]
MILPLGAGLLVGALAVPSGAPAVAMPARQGAASAGRPEGTYAVRGVVKTVSPDRLVITLATRHPSEMVLALNRSTLRTGTVVVGAVVSVRYRIEGTQRVATAVVVNASRKSQGI